MKLVSLSNAILSFFSRHGPYFHPTKDRCSTRPTSRWNLSLKFKGSGSREEEQVQCWKSKLKLYNVQYIRRRPRSSVPDRTERSPYHNMCLNPDECAQSWPGNKYKKKQFYSISHPTPDPQQLPAGKRFQSLSKKTVQKTQSVIQLCTMQYTPCSEICTVYENFLLLTAITTRATVVLWLWIVSGQKTSHDLENILVNVLGTLSFTF